MLHKRLGACRAGNQLFVSFFAFFSIKAQNVHPKSIKIHAKNGVFFRNVRFLFVGKTKKVIFWRCFAKHEKTQGKNWIFNDVFSPKNIFFGKNAILFRF